MEHLNKVLTAVNKILGTDVSSQNLFEFHWVENKIVIYVTKLSKNTEKTLFQISVEQAPVKLTNCRSDKICQRAGGT